MKVNVVLGGYSGSGSKPKPSLPAQVFLRAVRTQSGDGIAIEASLNSDFSGAERLAKVGTIGPNGTLAVKRYGTGDRIEQTAAAVSLDGDGRISLSYKSPGY